MNDPASDDEQALKMELLKMDIRLRAKQTVWETPRNIAIVVGTAIALSSVVPGWIGFKVGSTPPAPIVIQLQQPVTPPGR